MSGYSTTTSSKLTSILEGWLYLAFPFDVYSCKVVGRSAGNHLCTELVLYAPNMAIHNRCPAPGLVRRSDMGSQYITVEFGKRLKEAQLLPSRESVTDAFDNALSVSFIFTSKREGCSVDTRGEAGRAYE